MTSPVELRWPTVADRQLRADVHRVLHAVAERGSAPGYAVPPTRASTDVWLDETLALVETGDAGLVLAVTRDRVTATGLWQRGPKPGRAHSARLRKVLAHPTTLGLGLERAVAEALVDDARKADIETLTVGVRGDDHDMIEMYEQLGFREWGRLPNVVEAGAERYDDVRMMRELGRGPDVVLRGSTTGDADPVPHRA